MKYEIEHIHFVGIGGLGMSGIAEIFLNLGYKISGSDLHESDVTNSLKRIGVNIYIGHCSENINGANVVVISAAIGLNNPEVFAANVSGIPIVSRAVMLQELMRLRLGIAVSGTHGKTTTSSLIVSILSEALLDPTFIIGGILNSFEKNAKLGKGDYLVAEADESDASFLELLPIMTVVTNIDRDHMGTYSYDFSVLKKTFVKFLERLPFYGKAILCLDDLNICEIIPLVSRPIITYGLNSGSDIKGYEIHASGKKMCFKVQRWNRKKKSFLPSLKIELNLPGIHNVRNALAAVTIATELGISDEVICKALANFQGVKRRFTCIGEFQIDLKKGGGKFILIDDYSHHPTEIIATLSAARSIWPKKRVMLVFQPHRYTRTKDCFEDFIHALNMADVVLLTEVYSAGEHFSVSANGQSMYQALKNTVTKVQLQFVNNIDDLPKAINDLVLNDDIVIVMGAGSIGKIPKIFLEKFS
ncbi:MAG: UDP-N-acetylmuramate--L-alanine ligase [Bordetella sp.]|nr:MAG: UDP-N-acetylmuramate--L-alanine ligase [Bordetella sp.]